MSPRAAHVVRSYEHAIARTVLYCVQELPFPFGIRKTIGILRGSKATFVIEHHLHELTTYGILAPFSTDYLRHVIEVLLARELLTIEAVSNYDNMPVLRLTEQGDAFLSGQDVVDVRFVEQLCDREVVAFTDNEQLLFDTLRQVRRQLANANDLPAYVICHDTALREIVLQKPMTPDALLAVRGIGARFVESYGQSFLNVLWTHV